MARSHGRATRDTNGAAEVHTNTDKEILELLPGQKVTRRSQEGVERNANGAGDVAWLCVCQSEREKKPFSFSVSLIKHGQIAKIKQAVTKSCFHTKQKILLNLLWLVF